MFKDISITSALDQVREEGKIRFAPFIHLISLLRGEVKKSQEKWHLKYILWQLELVGWMVTILINTNAYESNYIYA